MVHAEALEVVHFQSAIHDSCLLRQLAQLHQLVLHLVDNIHADFLKCRALDQLGRVDQARECDVDWALVLVEARLEERVEATKRVVPAGAGSSVMEKASSR
jgi:hypothetical protein